MKIGIGALLVSAAVALLGAAAATSAQRQPQLLPASAGVVTALAFSPANPNVVYTATQSGPRFRVYKSTDGGKRWQRLNSGRGWFRAYAIAVDPNHPRTVYVGGGKAVYKTTNGGRTWHAFNRGLLPPPGINRGEGWVDWLAVDPANSKVLYEHDYAIRKSVDGGHTWKVVLRFGGTAPMLTASPATLYASFAGSAPKGGEPGFYRSANGGRVWRRMTLPAPGQQAVPVSASDPQQKTIYFADQAGVFASTDAGRDWHSIDQGLPSSQPFSLAAGGGTVIAGLGTDGIYISTNEGQSWSRTWPASGSAPGLGAGRVWVDPAHPATVLATAYYAANRPTGTHILRSTDGGRTWAVVG